MRTKIQLTTCQNCHRPLAIVYPYGEESGYFLPIDGTIIDLAQPGLIWCDVCKAVLPVAPLEREATQ